VAVVGDLESASTSSIVLSSLTDDVSHFVPERSFAIAVSVYLWFEALL